MPHIIILDEWEDLTAQLNGYCHTIQENIDNEMYEGEQLAKAESIIAGVTTFITGVNTAHRTDLDNEIAGCEAFLGI